MARPSKYLNPEDKYQAQLASSKRWKDKNKEYHQKQARDWYQSRTLTKEGYAQLLAGSAKKRTKDTDITSEFILNLLGNCAVTEKPFVYGNTFSTFSNPLAPSIDRLDNKKGYYKNNIRVVFNCINKMRNDLTVEQFNNLWDYLACPLKS